MTSRTLDRLSIRRRPRGLPLMRQWWGKLLFMHWPVEVSALRALTAEVQREHGFAVDLRHMAIRGQCATCQREDGARP
jgi:hypothetical protein